MTERSWITCSGLVLTACVVSSAQAGTIHPDLLSKLTSLNPEDEVSVIVTLTDQQDLKQFKSKNKKLQRSAINKALRDKAEKTQKPLKDFLGIKKARKIKQFWIFNGIAATIRAGAVEELSSLPEVKDIQLDATIQLPSPAAAAAGVPEWNLDAINAPTLWALGYTGTGVVIASMDSGVDIAHPDLSSRWRGGGNSWFDPHDEHPLTPHDNTGHGTGTMGIMVGGDAGGSAIGVAPDATWIAVKMFNDAGQAQYSDIHAGFQWLLDPDGIPGTDDAPDVVNNSWGFDQAANLCLPEFQPDIQALKASEIAVVVSAGNSGPGPSTSISPANYPESFAVGSVGDTLSIALSSSRGPSTCDAAIFPEIVAPGVNVRTADLTLGGVNPDPYAPAFGTSFAAPHVTGAMALMLSAVPTITVAELEISISQSAVDLGAPGADNDYGNGLLDVAAAYSLFTPYSIMTVNVTGKGTGSIITNPAGIDCPGDCVGEYDDGIPVTLTAVPDPHSRFTGWSGDCAGQDLTCQVTVDQVRSVTAGFYSFPWSLFVPSLTGQVH